VPEGMGQSGPDDGEMRDELTGRVCDNAIREIRITKAGCPFREDAGQ
jgi:hypothetical protein